jgi:hypothetical protein
MTPTLRLLYFQFALIGLVSLPAVGVAQEPTYTWTVLQPENDSRDADSRSYDEFISSRLVEGMNQNEEIFHHHLSWQEIPIKKLLTVTAPFCELRFDVLKPLILTDEEKTILREYMARGGFILLVENMYPYPQEVFWNVKSWPVIDFIRKELPAADPNFKLEKVTDSHGFFHQYYQTETSAPVQHELDGNPNTPSRTLLTYRNHPSAFVIGRYYLLENNRWTPQPKPYAHVFALDPKSYRLNVNIYIYVTMH